MAKYDQQLTELKNLLPTAKNILIALPANTNIDTLASSLALFLILEAAGKQVSVVCDDIIRVGQAHLFGVDHIQKNLPATDGGNLTLTLEGVAVSDNTIPALEKLDWYAQNNNLNLVFHVLPGQTFQPAKIVPHYQGGGFNLILVIGAANLTALGSVYSSNQQAFSGTHIVNIDNQATNTSFGQTNVLDTNASSVSEVMSNVLSDLGFTLNADVASNLLAGIFDATNNLTQEKASAETFIAVANCLRVGGRKPSGAASGMPTPPPIQPTSQPTTPSYDWTALMPKEPLSTQISSPINEYALPPVVSSPPPAQSIVDHGDDYSSTQPAAQPVQQVSQQPSPEERPTGERVVSETVEPEWLTPKIFKGSSIG